VSGSDTVVRRVGRRNVEVSHPDKVLFPDDGITKAELVDYYVAAARRMIPHLRGRPVNLQRFPDGIAAGGFFQQARPEYFPDWSDEVRDAMREETKRFIDHVLWEDDAKLSTLFTAPYSFVNATLAELYGASGGQRDDATFEKTDLDPTQRAGVLTQGAFMASYANPQFSLPIKRGKWVRVRMLCQDLPDPPANVPPPPAPAPNLSTRERFAMHTDSPACSSCHVLIDGLGFGLENFDGIGKFRTMENGATVDASGRVNESDVDEDYTGGVELAALLAQIGPARDCVPTQWLRYALGREEEDEDTCSRVAVRQAFASSGGDMRELMVALTQTDAFMSYRQPE
jgi:hypothetical protein